MKNIFSFFFLIAIGSLFSEQLPTMLNHEKGVEIVVNNRILAIVDNKPITVLDLMKRMDMLFFQQYPEYASSKIARYQFYLSAWKGVLKQVVNEELILSEVEESKMMPITVGDIRQEMETRFGPNIIGNLDSIGLSVEDARKMIKDEIAIRRVMMSFSSKGLKEATPTVLKNAYKEYIKEHQTPASWTYQVITIRNPESEKSAEAASVISSLLQEKQVPLSELVSSFRQEHPQFASTTILISEDMSHTEEQLSPAYKEVLTSMTSDSFSQPFEHKGRKDQKINYRIFYVKEATPASVPPFEEVAATIREQIISNVMERESATYLDKIRRRHAIEEEEIVKAISSDFTPFALQQGK